MKTLSRDLLLVVLAAAGLVVACVSLVHDVGVRSGRLVGQTLCSATGVFDCETVAQSKFAVLFGIPLSAYVLLYYLTLLVLAVLSIGYKHEAQKEIRRSLVALTTISVLGSVVMFCVSAFVLQAFCL